MGNNEKPPEIFRAVRLSLKAGFAVLLCISLIFLAWIMDRISINVAWFSYGWSYGFVANAFPVILVFLLLLALFNRVGLAYFAAVLGTAALYAVNHLKLKYLHVPVSFSDVYLLGNLHVATLELLAEYVSVWRIAVALLIVAALIGVALRFEKPWFKRAGAIRILVAATTIAGVAGIVAGSDWVGAAYNAHRLRLVPFSPLLTQVHSGLLSSVLYSDGERRRLQDITVDKQAVETLLAMASPSVTPLPSTRHAQPPDIVVVQSESFFDPAITSGISDTLRTLPNLHRALAAGMGGSMDPPTFGGGTLRTEFEVLTGIPMAAYPDMEFPYLQINQAEIPSFVRVARKAGYTTTAIHANSGSFWNRDVAFREIGFQRFITESDFPADANRNGWYVSDAAMTDEIIAKLDQARSPALIFAISIEAHGPYLNEPVAEPTVRDAIPAPAGLSGNALLEYRNYMYHIGDADRQLGRLWDFLLSRHHPFVLVFYGDHLPALTHFYAATGFDNGSSGPDQFVPWVIVGDGVEPRTMHIRSWGMGAQILRSAGIPLPPYFEMLAKARRLLVRYPDSAHQRAILQGIYSLARLHLGGRDNEYLQAPIAPSAGRATVAANP